MIRSKTNGNRKMDWNNLVSAVLSDLFDASAHVMLLSRVQVVSPSQSRDVVCLPERMPVLWHVISKIGGCCQMFDGTHRILRIDS